MTRISRIRWGIGLAVLALVGAALAAGWYYSDQILLFDKPSTLHEQRVFAANADRVRLSLDRESGEAGRWALEWEDGFAWLGPVRSVVGDTVERELRVVQGSAPVGGWASVRGVAKAADPRTLLGLAFEDVRYRGPLGDYPAWWIPGEDSTWVIAIHGRAASRAEALRTVSALTGRGLPILVIGYRKDAGAPAPPDGFSHLGATEWADAEAAVHWALAHGAKDVVLFGYSMGGQVVMQFLARSALASRVRGAVLESPMLDWNAGVALRASLMGVPPPITALGKWIATARSGLDWRSLDVVSRPPPPPVPILLFHGTGDRFAPFDVSERFAGRFPRQVQFEPYRTGNHVEAWNVDPEHYAGVVHAWLTARGVGDPRSRAAPPARSVMQRPRRRV